MSGRARAGDAVEGHCGAGSQYSKGSHACSAAGRRALVVCDQWLGSNSYAAMKALRRAGWGVTVIPEWEFVPVKWRSAAMRAAGRLIRIAAAREFNQEILRQAARWQPEMLLVFKGPFVGDATLKALRSRGVRTYCFYPDNSFRVHGPYLPKALPEYDWIFTTKTFGLNDLRDLLDVEHASVLLHAYDADLHRPLKLRKDDIAQFSCDASFIGTWSPKKQLTLTELLELLPDLKLRVWGEQWSEQTMSPALRKCIGGYEVVGDYYVRAIAASTINLALLSERRSGASAGDQITSRTFHIPACGGFMLHERTNELLEILTEDHDVVCFEGVQELARKVSAFLGDSERRASIAEAGRLRVTAAHSWDHRIRSIIDHHLQSLE